MNDYLIRVIAKDAGVRALAILSTNTINEIARRHGASPTATAVLAESLTNGALMGALLKVRQRVALKFNGHGPLEKIIVESDAYGKIRGFVENPEVELPALNGQPDILGAIGSQGVLTVVKDLNLSELVEGVVDRNEDGLSEDVARYLNHSEQTPSLIEFGLVMDETGEVIQSGGLLVQSLPPHQDELLDEFRERIEEMPPLRELLSAGETPESILEILFAGIEYEFLENRPVQFHCYCSRQRTEKALLSLGPVELRDLIEKEGEAVISCHFCGQDYEFSQVDLEMLLLELED